MIIAMADKTFYFGCWGRAGHFLYESTGHTVNDREYKRLRLPTPTQLDASILWLPTPEKIGSGLLTYMPALNRTILAWWGGNPWDGRGKVNQAIIVHGSQSEFELRKTFDDEFPKLHEALEWPNDVPLIVV